MFIKKIQRLSKKQPCGKNHTTAPIRQKTYKVTQQFESDKNHIAGREKTKIPRSLNRRPLCCYSKLRTDNSELITQNYYTAPCHFMASATLRKPAMFAPMTRLPFWPYLTAAEEAAA